jgi:threonine dehydratase
MSRPSTPTHLLTNGLCADSTPETPVNHNFALTEYAANPSPPSTGSRGETPKSYGVPEAYLLPNGTPDVRLQDHGLIRRVAG